MDEQELVRTGLLVVALLVLILLFALYVKFFPTSVELFAAAAAHTQQKQSPSLE